MTEYGKSHLLDVIPGDVSTLLEQGPGLCSENEILSGPGSGSPTDPFVDKFVITSGAGIGGEANRIADDVLGNGQ